MVGAAVIYFRKKGGQFWIGFAFQAVDFFAVPSALHYFAHLGSHNTNMKIVANANVYRIPTTLD